MTDLPARTRPPAVTATTVDRWTLLAAGWAALAGALALTWTLAGGYPFGANDPGGELSLLQLLPPDVAAPIFAVALLATAGMLLAMATPAGLRLPRFLLGFGWPVAGVLLIVVPDVEVLAWTGYAPMLIIGLPFGWPPIDWAEVLGLEVPLKFLAVIGGLLIAAALLRWQRRAAGDCLTCGRGEQPAAWTSPQAAARWGRWAVYVAATIPVSYALTRFAWLAGIPLGMSSQDLAELRESGAVWAGAGLGAFACVGTVLTFGLIQRWGEVFPRWMIGLAGRRVPIRLAVIPATFVAIAVTAGSVGLLMSARGSDGLPLSNVAVLPMLLWPLWGAALGAATLAYHLRRRGRCPRCGRI
jgi:hypothetical protein